MMRVKYVCRTCGSDDVLRDAYAKWDIPAQEWVVHSLYDNNVCEVCGSESKIDAVPADD